MGQAQAVPIPGLFNTGVDDAGVPLVFGDVDPHYTIVLPGVADAFVIDETAGSPPFPPVAPMWVPSSTTSKWISHSVPPLDGGGITYSYSLTFDLTGLDEDTAFIAGSWAVDDLAPFGIWGIFLNGVGTGFLNGGPSALTPFLIPAGSPLFDPGPNELEFVLTTAGPGFEGLRVEGITGEAAPLVAPIPEPATVLLLASGLAGLSVSRMRRRW